MKVKCSRYRHNAKQTSSSFTSRTGARRRQNGGKDNEDEAEKGHAQTTQLKKKKAKQKQKSGLAYQKN